MYKYGNHLTPWLVEVSRRATADLGDQPKPAWHGQPPAVPVTDNGQFGASN